MRRFLAGLCGLFWLMWAPFAVGGSIYGFCFQCHGNLYATPVLACQANGATWTPVFYGTQQPCGNGYGCCQIPPSGDHYAVERGTKSCPSEIDQQAGTGLLACTDSCESLGRVDLPVFASNGTTQVGQLCRGATSTCYNVKYNATGHWDCFGTNCTAGGTFLGYGSDTLPKCKGGCSYTVTAPTVSFFGTTGAISGVHSRWRATGATCTGGDTLVAGGTCNEMTSGVTGGEDPNYRMIYCGIQSPCPDGSFAFAGLCANDTAEDGCVVIDGESVCAEADQNCVIIDGKRICAELPDEQANELYKENGCVWSLAAAEWVCPTSTAKTEKSSTTTSVTDPVTGNTTKTTVSTQKDNLLPGVTTTTTTTVYDAEGNELSSESKTASTGSGGQAAALIARAPSALGEKADLEWLRTVEDVKEEWETRWANAPIVEAVASFADLQLTAGVGACPEFCLPLWGETLCTTAHCDIWEDISIVLQGVLLALYGMTAMRIVLSA